MFEFLRVSLFSAVLLLVSAGAKASWQEASAAVDQASASMMQVLNKGELRQPEQLDQLLIEIEQILNPVVDFEYVSKRVMGKYYRRVDSEQQNAFSGVFKDTMIRTFSKSLAEFDIVRYEMAPEGKPSHKPKKQIVSVYIYSAKGDQYTLVYYMLKQDDGWKLVNVLVDGINLRLNFKNQFAEMVSRAGGDVSQVISDWKVAIDSSSEQKSS